MPSVTKNIDNKDKSEFKAIISDIDNEASKKRIYSSLFALKALVEYCLENGMEVDISDSYAANKEFINKIDIADIRINGARVDVRAIVGNEYPEIWIPKDHFIHKFPIDLYVGVRISPAFDNVEIIGFIKAVDIDKQTKNKNYYVVDSYQLTDISQIEEAVSSVNPKDLSSTYTDSDHEKAKELFISYLDEEISFFDKKLLLTHLANCNSCKEEFSLLCNMNKKLSGINNFDNLLNEPVPDMKTLNNAIKNNLSASCLLSANLLSMSMPDAVAASVIKKNKVVKKKKGLFGKIKNIFTKSNKNEISSNLDGDKNLSEDINQETLNRTKEYDESISAPQDDEVSTQVMDEDEAIIETKDETQPYTEEQIVNENQDISSNQETYEEKNELPVYLAENEIQEIQPENSELNLKEVQIEEVVYPEIKIDEPVKTKFEELSFEAIHPETPIEDLVEDKLEELSPDANICSEFNIQELEKLEEMQITDSHIQEENIDQSELPKDNMQDLLANIDSIEVLNSADIIGALNRANKTVDNKKIATQNEIEFDFSDENKVEPEKIILDQNNDQDSKSGSKLSDSFIFASSEESSEDSEIILEKPEKKNNKISIYIAAAVLAGGVLTYAGVGFVQQNFMPKNPAFNQNPAQNDNIKDISALNKASLKGQNPKYKNINQELSKVFSQGNGITISAISWAVGSDLASDQIFKNYLIVTGQAIKTALSKDLLLAKSTSANNEIKVNIVVDLKGNVQKKEIVESSGSKEIDAIVLKSLNNTLNYTKLPQIKTDKKFIETTLIINL